MFMGDMLLQMGEMTYVVLTAVLFACYVNVQKKCIIMAESRYDKYVEYRGSFIILTARIVFGQLELDKIVEVPGMDLKFDCQK